MQNSKGLLTDSGGIQEETTFLNIPCLTLRDNTERPVTVDLGTNILLPLDKELILENSQHLQGQEAHQVNKVRQQANRLTPVRVAHSRRKDAKKSSDGRFNLGVFATLRETRFQFRP